MHIHAHTKQSEWWLTKNYSTPKEEQETRKVENATAWGKKDYNIYGISLKFFSMIKIHIF